MVDFAPDLAEVVQHVLDASPKLAEFTSPNVAKPNLNRAQICEFDHFGAGAYHFGFALEQIELSFDQIWPGFFRFDQAVCGSNR